MRLLGFKHLADATTATNDAQKKMHVRQRPMTVGVHFSTKALATLGVNVVQMGNTCMKGQVKTEMAMMLSSRSAST